MSSFCPIDPCLWRYGTTERLYEHLRSEHGAGMQNQSSADALDDLDDARDAVKVFESGLWWAVTALIVCVVLLIGGFVVGSVLPFFANAAQAASIVGGIGSGLAALFGMIWTVAEFCDRVPCYTRCRRAQRAYDRALRREGEKATGVA